jgi:hypothetical protein
VKQSLEAVTAVLLIKWGTQQVQQQGDSAARQFQALLTTQISSFTAGPVQLQATEYKTKVMLYFLSHLFKIQYNFF